MSLVTLIDKVLPEIFATKENNKFLEFLVFAYLIYSNLLRAKYL